ncbi:MAG TPA: hypothetical protein VE870_15370, partial [Bacteroidales bacterium]|nr:hypothetical protein [Bacteroidales bacterium]
VGQGVCVKTSGGIAGGGWACFVKATHDPFGNNWGVRWTFPFQEIEEYEGRCWPVIGIPVSPGLYRIRSAISGSDAR